MNTLISDVVSYASLEDDVCFGRSGLLALSARYPHLDPYRLCCIYSGNDYHCENSSDEVQSVVSVHESL